jgi:hypothetical protein
MSDKEYIKELEGRNAELIDTLDNHTLILDILKAKVNIVDSNFFKMIHPKQMCSYLEKLGWSVKYEKTHERFITRCYLSPHKDAKVKVFMQDLYGDKPTYVSAGMEGIPAKNKEIVSLLARIHKKGELEVIYEILSGKG